MIQGALLIFSCTSIFLFSTKKYYRYGFIAGLCGQPFWIWTAWTTGQWGIFAVSIWYTVSYVRGLKTHFKGGSK
jgi:hypothetical protein